MSSSLLPSAKVTVAISWRMLKGRNVPIEENKEGTASNV